MSNVNDNAPADFTEANAEFDAGKITTWADTVTQIGPISWEWPNWLAKGQLHIVAAEQGMGKSMFCLRIAGTYILGWDWPGGTKFSGTTGSVLWCEAEAGQALNFHRAKQWRVPLRKFVNPLPDGLADIQLDNEAHRARFAQVASRDDVRCLIVDSLRGVHSKDENSSESMELVRWLANMARNLDKPILLTHHLRKRGLADKDGLSLERLRGSTAITQPARIVLAIDKPDPNMSDVARLSVIKNNIARFPEPIGMKITANGLVFEKAPMPIKTESLLEKAIRFLPDLLKDGPIPANEVIEASKQANIGERTINQAKKILGVQSRRISGPDGSHWVWDFSENAIRPQ